MIDRTTPDQPAVWRRIEDGAPQDGTSVLLSGGSFYCEWLDRDVRTPVVASWANHGWLICGTEAGFVCVFYEMPQYWLPLDALPPPPGEGDGGGE